MRYKYLIILSMVAFAAVLCSTPAECQSILGSADDFAVLGGSTVTNTGPSTVTGDLGVSPGSAITGFPPGVVIGTIHVGNDAATQSAQSALTTAYNGLAAMPFTMLTGDLGGMTLVSGVYKYSSSAQLTGTLTLDAESYNNAYWVFLIGSTLTTASSSAVNVINLGSNNGFDDGLFWKVDSSATLGTGTAFEGNILALESITLNTGASIWNGRALAQTGAVTMDSNIISNLCPAPNNGYGFNGGLKFDGTTIVPIGLTTGPSSAVPEPCSMLLFGLGGAAIAFIKGRRKA